MKGRRPTQTIRPCVSTTYICSEHRPPRLRPRAPQNPPCQRLPSFRQILHTDLRIWYMPPQLYNGSNLFTHYTPPIVALQAKLQPHTIWMVMMINWKLVTVERQNVHACSRRTLLVRKPLRSYLLCKRNAPLAHPSRQRRVGKVAALVQQNGNHR